MNISLSTKKKICCLAGLCEHEPWDKTCPYVKVLDKADPNVEMAKQIESLIKTEALNNIRTLEKKQNAKSTKAKTNKKSRRTKQK